jgi:hypothetical protein
MKTKTLHLIVFFLLLKLTLYSQYIQCVDRYDSTNYRSYSFIENDLNLSVAPDTSFTFSLQQDSLEEFSVYIIYSNKSNDTILLNTKYYPESEFQNDLLIAFMVKADGKCFGGAINDVRYFEQLVYPEKWLTIPPNSIKRKGFRLDNYFGENLHNYKDISVYAILSHAYIYVDNNGNKIESFNAGRVRTNTVKLRFKITKYMTSTSIPLVKTQKK